PPVRARAARLPAPGAARCGATPASPESRNASRPGRRARTGAGTGKHRPRGCNPATDRDSAEANRAIINVRLRLRLLLFLLPDGMVDRQIVNDLGGGAILGFWSRAKNWSQERRKRTGEAEFLEWCEWLATQIALHRATRTYIPAYERARAGLKT